MDAESPVARLTNAILLASIKKTATTIQIYVDDAGASHVDFVIDDRPVREMDPPSNLHGFIVRRLGVMASVPAYGKAGHGYGRIHLRVGEQDAYFDVTLRGQGPALRAYVVVHGYRPHPPPYTHPIS